MSTTRPCGARCRHGTLVVPPKSFALSSPGRGNAPNSAHCTPARAKSFLARTTRRVTTALWRSACGISPHSARAKSFLVPPACLPRSDDRACGVPAGWTVGFPPPLSSTPSAPPQMADRLSVYVLSPVPKGPEPAEHTTSPLSRIVGFLKAHGFLRRRDVRGGLGCLGPIDRDCARGFLPGNPHTLRQLP